MLILKKTQYYTKYTKLIQYTENFFICKSKLRFLAITINLMYHFMDDITSEDLTSEFNVLPDLPGLI